MSTLQGHFLIASPALVDPNFARTVVLMVQHDAEGSLGLVLNRPTPVSIRSVWRQIAQADCDRDEPLFEGGPVEGPLMALHTDADRSEREILPGLHWATQKVLIDSLVLDDKARVRLYAGYAGWGGGQIEREIVEQSWLSVPATTELVFHDGDDLFRAVTAYVQQSVLGLSALPPAPPDVRMN